MEGMDRWDWGLFVIAVYVAVIALVRLMIGRRDRIIAHLREQIEREQHRNQRTASKGTDKPGDEAA